MQPPLRQLWPMRCSESVWLPLSVGATLYLRPDRFGHPVHLTAVEIRNFSWIAGKHPMPIGQRR